MKNAEHNGTRRKIAVIVLSSCLLVTAILAFLFIRHRRAYAVTDAVFVRAENLVTLGFEDVSGRLLKLNKTEGAEVKKGEVLAAIDPEKYKLEVEKTERELASTKKFLESRQIALSRLRVEIPIREEIAQQKVENLKKEISSFEASAEALSSRIEQLKRDKNRFISLYKARAVAKRRAEQTDTEFKAKLAEEKGICEHIAAMRASLEAAIKEVAIAKAERKRIRETEKRVDALRQRVAALSSALDSARRRLADCTIKSPINGRIAKKFASVGDVISPGTPVYALVNPADVYVLVLLEETKLKGVEKGCQASIKLDAYPDQNFKGTVTQVLPASAATFALIPRDISAGEFTKVSQRIPVKIRITEGNTSLLRVGLGGEAEIRRKES